MEKLSVAELEQLAPSWKIKTVRSGAVKPTVEQCVVNMNAADWNVDKQRNMDSSAILFSLQDGSSSAMSAEQYGALYNGDEAYAGSKDFYLLEASVRECLGYMDIVPVHTLSAASHIFNNVFAGQRDMIVLANGLGTNSLRFLIENRVVGGGAHMLHNFTKFVDVRAKTGASGNVDLDELKRQIAAAPSPDKIAYIFMQCNLEGQTGTEQAFSLQNLRQVKAIADEHGIPVITEASNIIGNAFLIRESNPDLASKPVVDIVREIAQLSDGALISGAQEFMTNTGACIAFQRTPAILKHDLYRRTQAEVVEYEGLHTYGGMAGRDMGVFSVGIREAVTDNHLRQRVAQVRFLGKRLEEEGVPVVKLFGTGAVFLDIDSFMGNQAGASTDYNRAHSLCCALYLCSGILAKPIIFENRSFVRLFVSPRAFTCNHLDYVARAVGKLYAARASLTGLREKSSSDSTNYGGRCVCSMNDSLYDFTPLNEEALVVLARQISSELDSRSMEPWVIRAIEHFSERTPEERLHGLKDAGFNTFLLRMQDGVKIDLLTDSGTNSQSLNQWAAINRSSEVAGHMYQDVKKAVKDVYGFEFVVPTHQGRMAEFLLSQNLIKEGDVIPGNMYFTTTKFHQEFAGARFVDVIVEAAHDSMNEFPFKGNVDVKKLGELIESQIAKHGSPRMPYISMGGPVNMAGGQPFSMQNLREVRALLDGYNAKFPEQPIRLVFDATRALENCEMVRERESGYASKTIGDVLLEMCSYFEAATMSSKKDNLVNIGGFLAIRDNALTKGLYEKCMSYSVYFDGPNGDTGLGERNLAALATGIREMVDEDYMHNRLEQVRCFGRALQNEGVPVVLPIGGHGVFIDATAFLHDEAGKDLMPREQYRAQALAASIFEVSGVRVMERGPVSAGRDQQGNEIFPRLELVRLTLPRRVYLDEQLCLAAKQIGELYRSNKSIRGLKMVYEPKALRFFQARFERV